MVRYDERLIKVGLKIAYYRKLNGLTQEQLAEKIGMSVGYLSQIEAPGRVQPLSLNMLFAIADALDVEPYRLLQD